MNKFVKGAIVAASVAGLVMAAGCSSGNTGNNTQQVKCEGGNACSGQGKCNGKNADGTEHTCEGKNACKGQGWVYTADQAACDAAKAANKT